MIKKYIGKSIRFITLIIFFTQIVGCTSKTTTIVVTGDANNVFTNEYFNNLIEIKDIFKGSSIEDNDKLQVICQAFSELNLIEMNVIETDPANVKTGHSFYQLHYSNGGNRLICILGNQIVVDEGVYEASEDINNLISEQFN